MLPAFLIKPVKTQQCNFLIQHDSDPKTVARVDFRGNVAKYTHERAETEVTPAALFYILSAPSSGGLRYFTHRYLVFCCKMSTLQ